MENKERVIIIGGDHHNTLSAVRCFGKHKCDIKILIHGSFDNKKEIRIGKSVYSKHVSVVGAFENDILQWLIDNIEKGQRQVIFPCSDLAAFTIDKHYDELFSAYILPGFVNSPGKVAQLMDKYNQYKLFNRMSVPIAKTWLIDISMGTPEDIVYPCVFKPVVSAFGEKSDIRIAHNEAEFNTVMSFLRKSNYSSVLVQEYLKKETEICLFGCITKGIESNIYSCEVKKIRDIKGSTLFAKIEDEFRIDAIKDSVLNFLVSERYCGQFDIEFLVCEDTIYLNEVNFRHSGVGFALINIGIDAPYLWYASVVGITQMQINQKTTNGCYCMNETKDFLLAKSNGISRLRWFKDFLKTKNYAYLDLSDLSGSWAFYKPVLRTIKNRVFKL